MWPWGAAQFVGESVISARNSMQKIIYNMVFKVPTEQRVLGSLTDKANG